jgi:uncharacterized protein (DUF1800 family)
MRADRGGTGPHFYQPPDHAQAEPHHDNREHHRNWKRRTALAALGGGAAAMIGGGAYAISRFFREDADVAPPHRPAGAAPASNTNENESYMNGAAGIGVRKNTPSRGESLTTPSAAAAAAVVKGNTVLPKKDPVRHLASRLTFGPSPNVIGDIKALGIDAWIDQQLKPESIPLTRGEQKATNELVTYTMSYENLLAQRDTLALKGVKADDENVKHAIARMIWSDRQLFEMMVDLFNDFLHVAAYSDGNELHRASFDREVIRRNALGNYADMLVAANRHPALLNYLDQSQSTKDAVNENLARENLELFTVGANNGYNETDVRQAALLQTGRGIRNGQYLYRPEQHYVGPVKVMGFSDSNASAAGGEAVQERYFRYIALHPNTARYLSQTIATRFVSDTPPKTVVDAMANTYLAHKGAIAPVLMTMLSRTEFWESVGQKVRRPMEYLTATYRALGVQPDAPAGYTPQRSNQSPFAQGLGELKNKLEQLGHVPMGMPTPNGYPDVYVAWTSVGTMILNWNEALDAIQGNRRMFSYTKPEALAGKPPATAGAYVDALTRRLVNATFDPTRRAAILSVVGPTVTAGTPVDATFNGAIAAVVRAIFATPHHHLR